MDRVKVWKKTGGATIRPEDDPETIWREVMRMQEVMLTASARIDELLARLRSIKAKAS